MEKLLSGFNIARRDPLIRRRADHHGHLLVLLIDVRRPDAESSRRRVSASTTTSSTYGFLYAAFGLGAALGAITVGTFLAQPLEGPASRGARSSAFAVLLAGFALVRDVGVAFPTVALLGFAYFMVITSSVDRASGAPRGRVRGRIMALWIMSFGGTVPLGVLVGGFLVKAGASITAVMLGGAVDCRAPGRGTVISLRSVPPGRPRFRHQSRRLTQVGHAS